MSESTPDTTPKTIDTNKGPEVIPAKTTTTPRPSVATTPSPAQIKEATEHLAKINSFIFGPSFNGKSGYNPYQWAADKNLMGLTADLENNPTSTTIAKILSIPADEPPKVVNPKSPRVDIFFEEQRRKAAADKEAALSSTKKNS